MRITGGEKRGRILKAPDGLTVRPTTDKIRQAIFNILAHETPGARVLDLFCGCGTLGIEALSRGAESVVFVDQSKRSLESLQANLRELSLEPEIMGMDWKTALGRLAQQNRAFDLILADPPYGEFSSETIAKALKSTQEFSLLAPEGVFIMESAADSPAATEKSGLRLIKVRKFGQTKLAFYTHNNGSVE